MVLALGLNLYANHRANVTDTLVERRPMLLLNNGESQVKTDQLVARIRQCVETLQREPKLKCQIKKKVIM